MTEKSIFTIVDSVGTGCGAAQVLGNSRPPQPPRVSEGQRDIRKPGRFRSATPNSSGLTPAVGVITPNVLKARDAKTNSENEPSRRKETGERDHRD